MFWVVRETSRHRSPDGGLVIREQRIAGYTDREAAERSARWYRREYRRRAYVESEADVTVGGGGTLYVVRAQTQQGIAWLRENVDPGDWNPLAPSVFYVEHRFIHGLVAGMRAAGLEVR